MLFGARDGDCAAPVCSPTRSTLYSGRVTTSTGIFDPFLVPNNGSLNLQCNQLCSDCGPCTLLPQVLKALGYKTQLFGKWHVGQSEWDLTPRARGFDGYSGYMLGEQDHFTHVRAEGFDFWNDTEAAYGVYGEYATYIYGPAAKGFIHAQAAAAGQARARGAAVQPWFMGVMTQTQHAPVQSPSECWGRFNRTIPKGDRQIQAGMVSCLDDAIGGILNALNETGQLDSTTIILHTDNGGINASAGSNMPLRGQVRRCLGTLVLQVLQVSVRIQWIAAAAHRACHALYVAIVPCPPRPMPSQGRAFVAQKHTLYEGGVRGIAAIAGAGVQQRNVPNSELLHVSDWYFSLASFAARGINNTEVAHPDSQGVLWWLHNAQMQARGFSGTPAHLLVPNGDTGASPAVAALRSAPPFSKWDGMDAWDAFAGTSPSPRDWILHAALPAGSGDASHADIDAGGLYRAIPSDAAGVVGPLPVNMTDVASMPRRSYRAPGGLLGAITMTQGGSLFKLIAGDFQTDEAIWFQAPGQSFSGPFTVHCPQPPSGNAGCDPATAPCLFNITADPCEHADVYHSQPTIAAVLEQQLRDAMSTAHAPVVGVPVPKSCQPNPSNNFTWYPCSGVPPSS